MGFMRSGLGFLRMFLGLSKVVRDWCGDGGGVDGGVDSDCVIGLLLFMVGGF